MTDGGTHTGGYTIMLPPGWRRIPLREGTAETGNAARDAIGASLRALPGNVPRDQLAAFRAEGEGRLLRMAAQVRRQGGVDLYLPAEAMRGIPVSASFVVSEGSLGAAAPVDPAQVVSYLAAGRDGGERTSATLDGAVGLRVEHVEAPDPEAEVQATTRRVDYIVSMPGQPDRWLIVAFSTLDHSARPGKESAHPGTDAGEEAGSGARDDLACLLVQLFDAMMSTFRWTWAHDGQR